VPGPAPGTSVAGGIAGSSSLDDPAPCANLGQSEIESMFRLRWVLAGVLILPIAELAVFIGVASAIGVLAALTIMLAISLAGAAVIRGAGRDRRSRFRAPPGSETLDAGIPGAFTVLAGMLLLVPGFLTDVAGLLLLVPALQRRILTMLVRGFEQGRRKTDAVVELDPDQWQRVAEEDGGKDQKRASAAHSCPPAPAVLATPPERGSSASRVKEEQ